LLGSAIAIACLIVYSASRSASFLRHLKMRIFLGRSIGVNLLVPFLILMVGRCSNVEQKQYKNKLFLNLFTHKQ
ncbi:MAG: hypothetical protein AB8F74_16605, partial [Saprospiraceae bacterium]